MFERKWIPALAAGTFAVSALAHAAEPTAADLQAQINALQSQLNTISNTPTATTSTDDVDVLTSRVIADADQRAVFLQQSNEAIGPQANFTNGFKLSDGVNSMKIGFQFQGRHVTALTDGLEENEHGFEIRRAKMEVDGTVLDEDLEYAFQFSYDRDGGDVVLQNAFLYYQFREDLGFRFGQWKSPVIKEELTSSKRQLAAERSAMNELIGGGVNDFIQGVALVWEQPEGRVRAEVAYTDGRGSQNTAFSSAGAQFGVYGRVDFLAIGSDFKPARDFSAMGTKEQTLILGAGADYTAISDASPTTSLIQYTFDAQFENDQGLGLFGAFVGQFVSNDDTSSDLSDYGVLVQAGYLVPNTMWEPFARFDITFLDDDRGGIVEDTISEFTAGVNYYFKGHNAKVTVDATFLPDGYQSGVGAGASGIGALNSQEDEIIIRGQFQLLI